MAWFKKDKGGDDNKREHVRHESKGEKVAMVNNGKASSRLYDLLDISIGGFCLTGYDGNLKGNQYFEFQLSAPIDGKDTKADGFATVVRVKDGKLAAKFTPQPRLKKFLRDYLE